MRIHWFPGHMTRALREMKESVSAVDSVIYVLDSRCVLSSINPAFDDIIGNKPRLYILNKVDLIPNEDAAAWKKYVEKNLGSCLAVNSALKTGSNEIISALRNVNKETIERYKARGVKKTIRAMVIGVPNCGKSTLINSLTAKKRTVTGDKPGVTRGKQWVSIDPYIDLLDTPGTLYPDFSDQKKAFNLAVVGSVKEDVLDINELAGEILKFLFENQPDALKKRYGIDAAIDLDGVAAKRGYILRGGEYDVARAAKSVIMDFRSGAYGKIALEKVNNGN